MPSHALSSRSFPPRLADLAFSIDVPEGFIELPIPAEDTDFSDLTKSAPIAVLSSQVALALITVAARPAYADGTVLDWLRYLASHFAIDLQHVVIKPLGKDAAHSGISAFGAQLQDGTRINLAIAAFEDGGRFVTVHGLCPAELWPSYGSALSAAVDSITLDRPQGPTHPVDNSRERARAAEAARALAASQIERSTPAPPPAPPADHPPKSKRPVRRPRPDAIDPAIAASIVAARDLLVSDDFDAAEQTILRADNSIQGAVKLKMLYEEHLRLLAAADPPHRDPDRLERVFRRALSWAQSCYPEPHTEIEAEQYSQGRNNDHATLTAVLGYDPDAT